jgi:apolipoprotein N-acyltransferase
VLGTRLIVWPESAPPDLANELVPYISNLYREARAHHSALVFGVVRASDDGEQYFNSVLALDDKVSWYDKNHLVPFSEFFPVPSFVRSWLRLHSLPYSDFTRGGDDQPPLPAAGLQLGTTVCYEDAYGSSMLSVLRSANALVNVTNDAWFGHSTARHQHFQIARMRAMEAGRFLIRAANDGISGVIGPRGEVIARAPEFTPYVLSATITPRAGLPPYAYVGNRLIVGLAAVALACGLWLRIGRKGENERTGTSSAGD